MRKLNSGMAAEVVGRLELDQAAASREAGRRNMLIGALWCFGGLAVTALTYRSAAGNGGGRILIAWGAILFGGIQFFRGITQLAKG